jgi:endonuclease/exonuclease/phosphatase family metal-dependent hydrolase
MTRRLLAPLGAVLLVDIIRTWLPTIITVFGQAASTPAELMGAFALLWFVVAFAAVPLARWAVFPVIAGVVLAICRLVLLFVGGQVLLYVASFGLLSGLCWLVALTMRGTSPRGIAVGLAAAAVVSLWRGPVGWVLAAATAAGFVVLLFKPDDARDGGSGTGGLLIGPVAFLALQMALSPSVAQTGVSYVDGGAVALSGGLLATAAGVVLFTVAVLAFVYLALRPPAALWARALGAVGLVAGAVAFTVGPGWLYVVVVPVTAAALGGCAGAIFSGTGPPQRGFGTAAGMLLFAVATFAYYASYDIGYPNAWVPPVVAFVVAVAAVRRPGVAPAPVRFRAVHAAVASAVVLALVALGAPPVDYRPIASAGGSPAELRVVAYNIRMAFGLDGRFSADRLAAVIRAERPDVVLLSEADRGWLLNGGHDDVQVLARELGMRYGFGPAADNVWGDAILTNLPVVSWRAERMPSYGAPTGAQVLGAVLRHGPGTVAVVSTHLQPPPGRPPLEQARRVARFAAALRAPGRPVIVGGDFNTEPGEEPFEAMLAAGFTDAFAARRPVLTSPADAPRQQIDHVFVAGGQARDVSAPRSTASDHLAVAVTISWPAPA